MRLLFILALSFFAATALPDTPAQEPPVSAVLAEIHVSGSSRYSETQVAAAAGLKPGDSVTPEQIQAAANRLVELGVFSKVNFRFSSRGDKITLNFEIEDAPTVPVAFDNFPWFTDSELAGAVREVAPLFGDTVPTDGSELDQMTAAIRKLLGDRGLPGTVEHRLVAQVSSNGMMMQFRFEGPEITVNSLAFGDTLARDSEKLRDRLQDLLHKPFSRFAVEIFENEQVRPLYLSNGNLRVHFGEPQVRFANSPGQPSSSSVSLVLPIDPGPVFHLATVDWNGVSAIPGESLQALLQLKPGELADGMRLAAGWQRVEAEYAHRGYLDAKVDPQPQFDDTSATVSYHVAVQEGPQYHMGDLVLTGLSPLAERVLSSYWALHHGEIFDGAYLDKMLGVLAKPSAEVFGELPVHYLELGHWVRTDPQTHMADVLLDFK